ncbi:MAG: DUF4215 domain-containing protein [Kofleriaceae bacterium]
MTSRRRWTTIPAIAVAALASACVEPAAITCDDGSVCGPTQACLAGGGCAEAVDVAACDGLATGAACAGRFGAGVCADGVCRASSCGDGVVASDEACDDGNAVDGDGCSRGCDSDETCGNGVRDVVTGEACDLGAANADDADAGCRTDCTRPRCGDGIVDPSAGEACDDGTDNRDAPGAGCRTDCQPARCGDGVLDPVEVCDDGNAAGGDGCAADCGSDETCGNGTVDVAAGEECDGASDVCRADCTIRRCGDGRLDDGNGEGCDDGGDNSDAPGAHCRLDCQLARCGDAFLDPAEVCDDGGVASGDGCSADCRSDETCGNGTVDAATGEQCDLDVTLAHDGCTRACTIELPRWQTFVAGSNYDRIDHAMAYDAARAVVVMFGGKRRYFRERARDDVRVGRRGVASSGPDRVTTASPRPCDGLRRDPRPHGRLRRRRRGRGAPGRHLGVRRRDVERSGGPRPGCTPTPHDDLRRQRQLARALRRPRRRRAAGRHLGARRRRGLEPAAAATSPSARARHGAAYDPGADQVVIFGGDAGHHPELPWRRLDLRRHDLARRHADRRTAQRARRARHELRSVAQDRAGVRRHVDRAATRPARAATRRRQRRRRLDAARRQRARRPAPAPRDGADQRRGDQLRRRGARGSR